MHPLLHLLITKPHLLAEHAGAYGELVTTEIASLSTAWKRRATLNVVAVCSFAVAAVLAGVSLMLSAVLPVTAGQALWVLIVVPLLPLAVSAGCLLALRSQSDGTALENLRQQLKADMEMIHEAGAE